VILDGIVEQCSAGYVRVPDAVVAEDPDRDPEQVLVMPTSA